MTKLERIGVVASGPLQLLLTGRQHGRLHQRGGPSDHAGMDRLRRQLGRQLARGVAAGQPLPRGGLTR